jgi:hypothetical protein
MGDRCLQRSRVLAFVAALGVPLAAGGGDDIHYDDGGVIDAHQVDAGVAVDAGIDAQVAPAAGNAFELTGAAGQLHGLIYTLDVQVGHGFDQRATGASGIVLEGNAAVKP